MNSFGVLMDRKMVYMVAIFALLLSLVSPMFASAAQITERSVSLSSSTREATGVQYAFAFDASDGDAGAVVVQFCSNTPLIGEFCVAPAGMTAAGATASGGATISGTPTANKVVVTADIASGDNTFTLGNITNPDDAGPLYVRVLTYADAAATAAYVVDDDSSALGSPLDQGSLAVSITNNIGVSGAVLESMTFCVSAAAPTINCGGVTAPTLTLGEDVGDGTKALGTGTSTGDLYTQISTNAVSGAIVSLKSSATCGGLMRVGASVCDIAPSQNGIAAGDAEFGVTAVADADPNSGTASSGTYQIKTGSGYTDSAYRMNWVSGNLTGVASTYGDPFLDTNNAPVTNRNMKLTFGAQINNLTPAGKYSADLSLIATGKF